MRKKTLTPTDVLLSITLMLFFFSSSVVLTLNFRPLYYHDIEALDMEANSGIPSDEIHQNYDALIDYNSIFMRDPLEFPTLPMSESGRIHFGEVKHIFSAVQVLMMLSGFASVIGGIIRLRQKKLSFLRLTAILNICVPAVLGGLIALNWQAFFVKFHELFFNNDYWIFDAVTDPVITILPDAFFMHCALLILALVILSSIACATVYLLFKRTAAASSTS